MKRLKETIKNKQRWEPLNQFIDLVEKNRLDEPNIALDAAKTIIETIAKTILNDKSIQYKNDSKIQFLIKKSFEALPIFKRIESKDLQSAKSIIGSFENIARTIGEFRNNYGFFSHGQDLQANKFDKYLVELVISSSDLISSFLIISHAEDLKNRSRIYYEENDTFNKYLDDLEESISVSGILISPSAALYTDEEAYKDKLYNFIDEKNTLIESIGKEDENKLGQLEQLLDLKNYLTEEEELKLISKIASAEIILSDNDDHIKEFIIGLYDKTKNILSNEISNNIKSLIEFSDEQ